MVNAMAEQKTPEQEARELIDAQLAKSGWVVQSRDENMKVRANRVGSR